MFLPTNLFNILNLSWRELPLRNSTQVRLQPILVARRGDADHPLVDDPSERNIRFSNSVLSGEVHVVHIQRPRLGEDGSGEGCVCSGRNALRLVKLRQLPMLQIWVVFYLVDSWDDLCSLEDGF